MKENIISCIIKDITALVVLKRHICNVIGHFRSFDVNVWFIMANVKQLKQFQAFQKFFLLLYFNFVIYWNQQVQTILR